MACYTKPSRAALGRLAEKRPDALNPLVAFFVMGWDKVILSTPMHGVDQTGTSRMLPDYVKSWGVNMCVHYILRAPDSRHDGEDFITEWLAEIAYDD